MTNKNGRNGLIMIGAAMFLFYCYSLQVVHDRDKLMSTALLALMLASVVLWYISMKIYGKKEQDERLTDKLTNLSNRESFIKELNSHVSNGKPFAVVSIDINDFSDINNLHGSSTGDLLLIKFGQRLIASFDGSTFARVGGDEFAILIENYSNKAHLESRIKSITPVLQSPFYVDDREFMLNVSTGVAIFPEHGENSEEIMKSAGIACHNSKLIGKGYYLMYDPEMNDQMIRRMRIQNDIPKSLTNDEFTLYYQPQIDAATNKIVSVEALIRWNHPELGKISPVEFIPIAEKSGAILAIDEWVFRTACKQSVMWRETDAKDLKISVNFSMQQFKQFGLIPMVLRVIEETGADPTQMNIEITETTFMQNAKSTISILEQLKRLNVSISLDDFGTGYSSLSYLRQLPLTSLKLDKSFVDHMLMDKNGGSVVKSIVSLARDLDLEIVAEGVESDDQFEFLKTLGCEKIQGYLFSPPVTPKELEKMVKTA